MTSIENIKNNKFKVLCLHGIGTNSEVFEAQTAALRYQMGSNYEYDFLGGAYPWPAAPGIAEVFGNRQMYYSYFDESEANIKDSLEDLAQYILDNGPFDVIMGFSLGAALVATLMLRNEMQEAEFKSQGCQDGHARAKPICRCAVFICGTLPCDWNSLVGGNLKLLQADNVRYRIKIPTVHAWSQDDADYPNQSQQLVLMCDPRGRVEILHRAGHGVPSQGEELVSIAKAVETMLTGADN